MHDKMIKAKAMAGGTDYDGFYETPFSPQTTVE